jgi:hypothetical protein
MLSSKSYKRNTKHYTKNWRIRKHIASSCSQTTTSSPDQPKSTRSTSRTLSSTKGTLSLQPLLDHPSHPFFDHHSTYHSTIAAHSSTILPSILPAIPKRRLRPRRKIFRMSTSPRPVRQGDQHPPGHHHTTAKSSFHCNHHQSNLNCCCSQGSPCKPEADATRLHHHEATICRSATVTHCAPRPSAQRQVH